MESILDAISDDSMTSVGAAVEPGADVVVFGKDVDQLAFAFISPLRAKNDSKLGVHAACAAIGCSLDQG